MAIKAHVDVNEILADGFLNILTEFQVNGYTLKEVISAVENYDVSDEEEDGEEEEEDGEEEEDEEFDGEGDDDDAFDEEDEDEDEEEDDEFDD